MFDLIMMVPSRGRPENVKRLSSAWSETTSAHSKLVILVDDDDDRLDEYMELDGDFEIVVGQRLRIGGTLNDYAPKVADTCFSLGFMGDDHVPRTKCWDEIMVSALKSVDAGIAYGNDLHQGANLPTAVVMTSNIVRAIGYFVMPGGIHLYLDNFWLAIGKALGSAIYLPEVIIEHLHPSFGEAEWDDVYSEANSQEMFSADKVTFDNYIKTSLNNDIEKIRGFRSR
jgi:hypothetical protein